MAADPIRLVLTLLVLTALLLAAWAVARALRDPVSWQRRRLLRIVERAGLTERRLALGPDTVQFWDGGGRDGGAGRAVLLVHGFGGDAIWQWAGQARGLAGQFRLIVPNLIGFGDSRSDDPDPSVDHQVRALVALLSHLGAPIVDVVGLSYGGVVAAALAARHPERVRRLVLVDTAAPDYGPADLAALQARFGVADLTDLFVPRDRAAVRALVTLAYHRPPATPGFALDAVVRGLYRDRAEALRAILGAIVTWADDPAGRPPPAPHETLLVWGRHDPVFPLAEGQRYAAALGERGRLVVIDAAAHAPNLEHPARFNALLTEFLS